MRGRPVLPWVARLAIVVALAVGAGPRSARANGAFPDSYQILLPRDAPKRIVFSTNFGLVISDDDGVTWTWTCEQTNSTNAFLYQMGAPPSNNLYAISSFGLAYSHDDSCTWELAKGRLDNALATDSFPHPTDPMRILAIAAERVAGEPPYGIYPSSDGGKTFGAPIYVAPAGGGLLGVEVARSDPRIISLAMFETPGIRPRLVRSVDDGKTWAPPIDLEPKLGANWLSIIAVDPGKPDKIFFRVQEALGGELLAITDDLGVTVTKPVRFADRMTAFLQLASGTILVTGISAAVPVGFRSTDGGKTFTLWTNVPSVRALGERAGRLFILGDNFIDKFALAVSVDEGMTLQPMTTYAKVSSIPACVHNVCQPSCNNIVEKFMLWTSNMCLGGADGGAIGPGAGADDAGPPPGGGGKTGGGCHCGAAGIGAESGVAAALAALALLLISRRRRRSDAR